LNRIDAEHRTFDNALLDQAERSGLISHESAQQIRNAPEAEAYSSLRRHFGEDELSAPRGEGGGKPGALKAREGSERKVIPPVESTIVNTASILRAVERNKLNSQVADLVNANPELGKEIKLVRGGGQSAPKDSFTVYTDGRAHVYQVKPDVAQALWNSIVPFLNMRTQGMELLAKSLKDPRAVLKWAAMMTLPSVGLWALNKDDPEYAKLPDWQKDYFWNIPRPGGGWYTVPKPFIPGQIFGTVPERILQGIHENDPGQAGKIVTAITREFTSDVMPTAISVPAALSANYDFFSRRNIEPQADSGLDPFLRGAANSSQLAKWAAASGIAQYLSEKCNTSISPAKIDYFIRNVAGNLGAATSGTSSGTWTRKCGEASNRKRLGRGNDA